MKIKKFVVTGLMLVGLQGITDQGQAATSEASSDAVSRSPRPQVLVLLQAAQVHQQQKKPELALKKLAEIDAIPDLTEWERYLQARTTIDIIKFNSDTEAMIKALLVIRPMPYLPPQEAVLFDQILAGSYLKTGQYARLIDTMSADIQAGRHPELLGFLAFAYFLSGDFKHAALVQRDFINSAAATATPADAGAWLLLANACNKINDSNCYLESLEKALELEYSDVVMQSLLIRLGNNGNHVDRLQVEIYRLGQQFKPLRTSELIDFIRLLLLNGAPAEATTLVETAFKSGALGKGEDAPRHERLRALVAKEYARATTQPELILKHYKTGRQSDKIVELGYDLVHAGSTPKGIELIESAIASGEIKDMGVAKLHLGLAYAMAGRNEEAAAQLSSIPGDENLARLGRLWAIQNKQSALAKPRKPAS